MQTATYWTQCPSRCKVCSVPSCRQLYCVSSPACCPGEHREVYNPPLLLSWEHWFDLIFLKSSIFYFALFAFKTRWLFLQNDTKASYGLICDTLRFCLALEIWATKWKGVVRVRYLAHRLDTWTFIVTNWIDSIWALLRDILGQKILSNVQVWVEVRVLMSSSMLWFWSAVIRTKKHFSPSA